MDLSFSKEEIAFRDEVRSFFRDNVPAATRQKLQEGRHLSKQEMIDWWRILNKKGWGVSHWPKEYGGTGWTRCQHYISTRSCRWRRRRRRSPSASAWSALSSTLRQRGAEEALSAAHCQCRRLVVPGLLRAGLRLRPCFAQDQGRAQGRQIYRQRPEDLDHAGAARRHDLLPVPHRSFRQEAVRHLPSS